MSLCKVSSAVPQESGICFLGAWTLSWPLAPSEHSTPSGALAAPDHWIFGPAVCGRVGGPQTRGRPQDEWEGNSELSCGCLSIFRAEDQSNSIWDPVSTPPHPLSQTEEQTVSALLY